MADSVETKPRMLEAGWSSPVTVAAAWAIAKPLGGTLDYKLLTDEDIAITVSWVSDERIEVLKEGAPWQTIYPSGSVQIFFTFHVDHYHRMTPEEQRAFNERTRGRL